jgi:pSer/pThr/pTyr-binding forkhead associated (FHA) protein
MVQFDILTGKKAGTEWVARRFPFHVGRAAPAGLTLDDDGVWERHVRIDLRPAEGVVSEAAPEALMSVNGQRVEKVVLRNGDILELGSVKLRFGLGPTRQRGLRFREAMTWIALASLCLGQVALIYWLAA